MQVVARSLAKDSTLEEVTLDTAVLSKDDADFGTQITALNQFKSKIQTALDAMPSTGQTSYTFADVETSFRALMSGVTVAGKTTAEIKKMKDDGGETAVMNWFTTMPESDRVIRASSGLFVDAANFIAQCPAILRFTTDIRDLWRSTPRRIPFIWLRWGKR